MDRLAYLFDWLMADLGLSTNEEEGRDLFSLTGRVGAYDETLDQLRKALLKR